MPLYETLEHRERQQAVTARVARHFGWEAIDLPTLAPVDCLLALRPRVVGACEVKVRTCHRQAFDTVWVNEETPARLRACHGALSFEPYDQWTGLVAIQWADGLWVIEGGVVEACPVELRSLTVLRDPGDEDNPVYLVPTDHPAWQRVRE